ncbi:MAG: hypothetical protein Q7Q73_06875 [Verrucomicrobiota bacterium JB024]|nr:hypothetical protein [Verrucomicrobiota bacterium JB024]
MKTTTRLINSLCYCLLFTGVVAAQAETIAGTSYQLNYTDTTSVSSYDGMYTASTTNRLGSANSSPVRFSNYIVSFQLPELGAVENPFATAAFSVAFASYAYQEGTVNIDLYGIDAGASADPTSSMGYFGASDPATNVTLVESNFLEANSGYTADQTISTSASALVDYLNAQYAGGAGAGQYVYLRLNPTITFGSAPRGYNIYGSGADSELVPQLSYTIPEPSSVALWGGLVVGLGLVLRGLRRRG